MLMVAELGCIMGGVEANLVVDEVFESSGGVIAVEEEKAGIVQDLMSFGRKADLFLEQDSIGMMLWCLQ